MHRKIIALFTVLLLLLLTSSLSGCGAEETKEKAPSTTPTAAPDTESSKPEPESEPVKTPAETDIDALFSKIKTGMTYEQVKSVMGDQKPFTTSESAIDTPMGKTTMRTISWCIDSSLITVIFENEKVMSKDLTKINP